MHPTPSLRTYPLARTSHVLQRPSTDSMPAAAAPSVGCGASFSPTAAAVASAHSPPITAPQAPCSATSPDEHAVSMLTHGPCSPSVYEIRPAAAEATMPCPENTLAGSCCCTASWAVLSLATS